eukprot:1159673-Pelagomonas_calceolata.AAC.1
MIVSLSCNINVQPMNALIGAHTPPLADNSQESSSYLCRRLHKQRIHLAILDANGCQVPVDLRASSRRSQAITYKEACSNQNWLPRRPEQYIFNGTQPGSTSNRAITSCRYPSWMFIHVLLPCTLLYFSQSKPEPSKKSLVLKVGC